MDLHVNRQGKIDVGIVYRRGLMEFWVPSTMQPHLPYNPQHLPVIPVHVDYVPVKHTPVIVGGFWRIISRFRTTTIAVS